MSVLEKILEEISEEIRGSLPQRADGLIKARAIIRSHMDEVENDGWISVEEKLPEEGTIVIGYDDGKMLIGRACIAMDGSIVVDDGAWETLWDVRAWMKAPEPYKPKKNIPVAGMDHIMSRFTKVE